MTKRVLSVKRARRSKDYTSMKAVGVKSIDETFKVRFDLFDAISLAPAADLT